VPNKDVVERGVLIRFTTKLINESNGVSVVRNLNQTSALPTATIGVIGMPQMVFINPITTIDVNKIADRPLISLMVVRRYRCRESKKRIPETICYNCINS